MFARIDAYRRAVSRLTTLTHVKLQGRSSASPTFLQRILLLRSTLWMRRAVGRSLGVVFDSRRMGGRHGGNSFQAAMRRSMRTRAVSGSRVVVRHRPTSGKHARGSSILRMMEARGNWYGRVRNTSPPSYTMRSRNPFGAGGRHCLILKRHYPTDVTPHGKLTTLWGKLKAGPNTTQSTQTPAQ